MSEQPQTCQQPVCAVCGHRGHSGSRDYPGEDHPFQPTPCGEALNKVEWRTENRMPGVSPGFDGFAWTWLCPIHGEAVRA